MRVDPEGTPARARVVAFYLPQFHPIPENDRWWGNGFTEWTNVTKATPLYRGHRQPNLPGELGFYDLRVPDVRAAQAALAESHGVEAFCYWHYWFAGDRLLERPFDEVLRSGEPTLPFCLAWANQSWTGIWHGAPDRVLKEQTYPGRDDYAAHFDAVREALTDPRYFTVDGEPLFAIFKPDELPDPDVFVETWRTKAADAGLPGIHLVGISDNPRWDPHEAGFDAATVVEFSGAARAIRRTPAAKVGKRLKRASLNLRETGLLVAGRPTVYDYAELRLELIAGEQLRPDQYPCVLPNWDNTPRSGRAGVVLHGATPALFRSHLAQAVERVQGRPADRRIVFVKSWNEWAEGNYLEPDQQFGREWLEAVAAEVWPSG